MSDYTFEHKMVFVVREDLQMSPGKIAAQVAHAAVMCALETEKRNPELLKQWLEDGYKKVVLKAPGMLDLMNLEKEAKYEGLVTTMIIDAGRTEVARGSMTVLGIGPEKNEKIDKVTGKLRTI